MRTFRHKLWSNLTVLLNFCPSSQYTIWHKQWIWGHSDTNYYGPIWLYYWTSAHPPQYTIWHKQWIWGHSDTNYSPIWLYWKIFETLLNTIVHIGWVLIEMITCLANVNMIISNSSVKLGRNLNMLGRASPVAGFPYLRQTLSRLHLHTQIPNHLLWCIICLTADKTIGLLFCLRYHLWNIFKHV